LLDVGVAALARTCGQGAGLRYLSLSGCVHAGDFWSFEYSQPAQAEVSKPGTIVRKPSERSEA